MDIYLDNQPLTMEAAARPLDLSDILQTAQQQVAPQGRLIVEVRIDGQPVAGHELEDLAGAPLKAEELQLITADPQELGRQTLQDVRGALLEAQEHQQNAAQKIHADELPAALEHVRVALGIWQQAEQAIRQCCTLLHVDLENIVIPGSENERSRTANAVINELAQLLTQVRDDMQNQDWVALADAFSYELDDAAATWVAMIDAILGNLD